MDVGPFCHISSERMRGNGLKTHQERFSLGIRKIFTNTVIRHWNKLPREVVESLSLEVSKRHPEVAAGDMVRGDYVGTGLR